jgi:phosphoserine phosphatase
VGGAAFFDLDRTLLARSSSLALAPAFRRAGLIGRLDVAKATVAQLFFVRFGAGHGRTGKTAESAMAVLEGVPVDTVRELVAEAVGSALRPHVYREALDLVAEHDARGERSYVVSAALQEVVDGLTAALGLVGGVGSRAEVVDGRYTGQLTRRLYLSRSPSWRRPRTWSSRSRPRTRTPSPTSRSWKRSGGPSS